jgi:hypothetical protein
MAEIDEQMVLTRAKARSEQDGFTWYFDVTPLKPGTAFADIPRPLSEARRRLYLEKAREELNREADANS